MRITIRAARVNAGLTQAEAAKNLNISKGTLVNYEKYRTSPGFETAEAMASLYGLKVSDLIFLPSDCALSTNAEP